MAKKGIHVNVYKLPDGTWRCDLKLNTTEAGEGVTVRGTSEKDEQTAAMGSWWDKLSKAGRALAKTRIIATGLLSNPAVAAAFPMYVGPALVALKAIEAAERKGVLGTVKKQFKDPTLKKLATEMDEMSKGQRSAMSGGGCCLAEDRGGRDRRQLAGRASPFGLESSIERGPFGLPKGNPHPFGASVMNQILKGVAKDPIEVQKLVAMQNYQRRMARNSR
jgi:hypothetical protein